MAEYIWETPEEMNKALANRLRKIRKTKGISQENFSKISGVSFGTIKRFESTGKYIVVVLDKAWHFIGLYRFLMNLLRRLFVKKQYY